MNDNYPPDHNPLLDDYLTEEEEQELLAQAFHDQSEDLLDN